MDPKLYVAAADGGIHIVQQYNDNDIHRQLTPENNTVLHVAAKFGQADCVDQILSLTSHPLSLLQQPNKKGDTPLHLAARAGHLSVVKNLIDAAMKDTERGECKMMLRITNNEKNTALHEAVRNRHRKVVKLLIQEDPEFVHDANAEGKTPLYIAAEWGFGDLVQMILDDCKSPGHGGINGRNVLHAAVLLDHKAMTKKILEKKPDLTNKLDEKGWSPLHLAAYVGCRPTIVRQLLEKSDKNVVYMGVNYQGTGNRTALHIAASRGHLRVVKVLVSHFPDCSENVDDKGNNILHLIMPTWSIFLAPFLSKFGWLRVSEMMNDKNLEGKTPFHRLHNIESPETFSLLLDSLWTTLEWMWNTSARLVCRRVSARPLGSLEIEEESYREERAESEEVSEIKKSIKNHMIVATLIATVTFAAAFTLPGGYVESEGDHQGLAVLSIRLDSTTERNKEQHMANLARKNFRHFVTEDGIAMILSICAIGIYFLASFPNTNKKKVLSYLGYGSILTMAAMVVMVFAFIDALQAVLHHSFLLEDITFLFLAVFLLLFGIPFFLALIPSQFLVPFFFTLLKLFT